MQRAHFNIFCILFISIFYSCNKKSISVIPTNSIQGNYNITKTISYGGITVDVVIDKPENNDVDVLIVYHGTATFDNLILQAANTTLTNFKAILTNPKMMIVSVAYPEENLLFGDNIKHAEAALLWVKHSANQELGIQVKKIFLAGHSQGGYLVTRLNTMHATHGVIANAPGPLNLVYRCQFEEKGEIPKGAVCSLLYNNYGSTSNNPDAYYQRSLLNFTQGFKSDILFVQGLDDSPIQMYSYPIFRKSIEDCQNCQYFQFLELANFGHTGLFHNQHAKEIFNKFISDRL